MILINCNLDDKKYMPKISNTVYAADKVPHYGAPGTNKERSFIAVKPDGVHRGLVGEVVKRFEAKGYKLVAIKVTRCPKFKNNNYF